MECHIGYASKFARSGHANTFFEAKAAPEKIVAHFGEKSPLKREDIAYVIGMGRGEQRYCDAPMRMLPFRWDIRHRTAAKMRKGYSRDSNNRLLESPAKSQRASLAGPASGSTSVLPQR